MSEHDEDEGGMFDSHEEHDSAHTEEPWLVSYADMMTLLFGFFVLMYTLAMAKLNAYESDDEMFLVKMRKEVAAYFGGEYITPLAEVEKEFKKALGGDYLIKNSNTKLSPEGMQISFRSTAIFATGSAELDARAASALKKLIEFLPEEHTKYRILVEGHTDDVPIGNPKGKYPSNWELSAARASTIVRLFENNGKFYPTNLVAIGYGETRPAFPHRDENGKAILENRQKNRRINIKIGITSDIRASNIETVPETL